jgi:hypothetical protein
MAIPAQSLSGTEVLRRGAINALTNNWTALKFDGTITGNSGQTGNTVPANHIITVLNFTACEQGNTTENLHVWVATNSADHYIVHNQEITAYRTFVHNDRFTLVGGDKLAFVLAATGNVDIWVNYIDQSWE